MQAPKTRKDEKDRRGLLLVVGALLALALVGGGVAAWWFLVRDDATATENVEQAMTRAGCELEVVEALASSEHIEDPDAEPEEWNTFPPTSGPHYGQWVIWGEYDDPVRLAEAVHNLEHGGIVMYYGENVPDEEVAALRRFYRDDPVAMLMAPLPRLDDRIALTAWHAPRAEEGTEDARYQDAEGVLARCESVDADAFRVFRDTYRFQGPERIPPENLQPGM